MFNLARPVRSKKGFTLIETLVAISIFAILIGVSLSLFANTSISSRRTEVSRNLYEETRITLERIVKEVRRGTIDYEEYWNWSNEGAADEEDYGKNYGEYAAQFFDVDPKAKSNVTRYSENLGVGPEALSDYEQAELYLIDANGTEKTIIKKISENVILGSDTYPEERLVMLKLNGIDSTGDAIMDSWIPLEDYQDYTFQKIQPDTINITDLSFYISPLKDPHKAFAEFADEVQVQPHVTIVITAEPSITEARGIQGDTPSLTLQTTVSARAFNEIKSLR